MGTVIWQGHAEKVPQVDTITLALTWDTADTEVVTINDKTLTLTVGTDDTTGGVATAVKEMINGDTQTGTGDHTFSSTGSVVGEFAKLTATVSGSVVTVTGPDDGQTFTMTSTPTTAGDGTAAKATATTGAGPNFWSLAGNWDTGAVPVAADDVVIESTSVPIKYGIDQNAVTLTSLTIKANVGSAFYIGLPETNVDNSSYPHAEYLETHLKISATTITIGEGDGSGIKGLRINTGTNATTMNIYKTGASIYTDLPPIQWVGVHATNAINVQRGHLGIAVMGGEAATYLTLNTNYIASQTGDVTVKIGSGVTHQAGGTITQNGGSIYTRSAIITSTQEAGSFYLDAAATATTIQVGGTLYDRSSGTITTLRVLSDGTYDKRLDGRAKTITNAAAYKGAKAYDPQAVVTWTNGIDLVYCGLEDVTLELGINLTWTPTAI